MNTADLTCFQLSISDHIAHLVLSRPEAMNTMGPAFWHELDQVLEQLHQGGQARVLLVSSTGKHFSAGMALEVFGGAIQMDDASPEGRAAIADLLGDLQATFSKLEALRIPVIVAIQGGCIGGAVDLVTAACIRYATQDAFFVIQEINIGMVADVGTLQRLPKLMPLAVVKELAYTGRRLPATKEGGQRWTRGGAGKGWGGGGVKGNGPTRPAVCPPQRHANTAWSTRCSTRPRPALPPRCSARARSPPSHRSPSGAASR